MGKAKAWAKAASSDEPVPVEELDSSADSDGEELEWEERPASLEEFAARLRLVGLGDHAGALVALTRDSLRLVTDELADDPENAPVRLGGRPLLPPDAVWPRRNDGAPLSLIAQLSLPHLAEVTDEPGFPAEGSLAFFYDGVDQSVWGFSPSDVEGWKVLHCAPGVGVLHDFPADLDEVGQFSPVALVPKLELTYPPAGSFEVEQLLGEQLVERYWAVVGEDEGETITRFLGHPEPVQGDMQAECQLASNGVYVGDPGGYASPDGQRLRPGAAEWRLLLQVDSHDDAGMMWGDVGRLYWWIREADLAEGRWGASWLVLQCC